MPGSTPPTSQLDWLISTTAITVLSWSRATRDLLKSFGWGIRALHQLDAATMVPSPRRLPHTISPLEGGVSCELVSERENTGNFVDSELSGAWEAAKRGAKSVSYGPIPYASQQGIFCGL